MTFQPPLSVNNTAQASEVNDALEKLARQLENSVPPQLVLSSLCKTLVKVLRAPQVLISLRRNNSDEYEVASQYQSSEFGHVPSNRARPQRYPITFRGETIGQLIITHNPANPPNSQDIERLIGEVAQRVGSAAHVVRMTRDLQHARERLVLAREEERRKLRRNLHDAVGPMLTALMLKMGALRDRVRADSATEAMVNELREQIRSVVTQIRYVIYDLRPPALEELGLLTTIREQAQQFSVGELQVEVYAPDFLPMLPAAVEVATYRIILEALSNVARHSHATHCEIRLHVTDHLLIDITDNGIGLPERLQAGVGISSIRERVAELGGNCTFQRPANGGTLISVRLPMFESLEHGSGDAGTEVGKIGGATERVVDVNVPTRKPTSTIKVMLVDDHRFFRDGVRNVLQGGEGIQVVAETASGTEAVELAAAQKPDVVLMDLQLPGMSGIEVTQRLLRTCPSANVVVLSMAADTESVLAALRAGARGYILKDAEESELLRAIYAASDGQSLFGPAVSRLLYQYASSVEFSSARLAFPELTEREREVLGLMAQRLNNEDIADRLGTSLKTVRNQVSSILSKMQVADREEAAARARAAGLTE